MTSQDISIVREASRRGSIENPDHFVTNPVHLYGQLFKRVLDLSIVLLALPIVLPLIMMLAAWVALDGANPLYAQRRVGRNGRVFTMWKLRSMVPNAHALLEDYLEDNPSARNEWDETQKLKDDPRITSVGRILRRTSLDELPQLWNVLVGEMSLVGPRPMMPEQQKLYPGTAYFTLRPGLTGPWQVSKRNSGSFASRAEFDTSYAQNLTLKSDLSIIYSTVGVVIRATGC